MQHSTSLYVHADDFGLSKEISENIAACISFGTVNSISVICTSRYFEPSIGLIKSLNKYPRICLHLNLVEGRPLSDNKAISWLVNKSGEFRYSFFTLWVKYLQASKSYRAILRHQLKTEIAQQMFLYTDVLKKNNIHAPLCIDSHTHIHLIPFVSNIILELSDQFDIKHIRVPYEKLSVKKINLNNFQIINFVKNRLLNNLSFILKKKIAAKGINSNDFFIGVLHTGNMSFNSIISQLQLTLPHKNTEILLHPGGVNNIKSINWTKNNKFKKFYTSGLREKEKTLLLMNEFKKYITDITNS